MKLGELQMHCGNCSVIELCGEAYSDICLCANETLKDMEEKIYKAAADEIRERSMGDISNEKIEEIICKSLKEFQKE